MELLLKRMADSMAVAVQVFTAVHQSRRPVFRELVEGLRIFALRLERYRLG
jgi:hypothetical protein